jgi:MerR HTH family regulatory protein
MLINNVKSTYQKWYQQNQPRLSEKRKKQYAENPEYRQKVIEASRRRRSGDQTPPAPPVPPDGLISFEKAADRLGVGTSTLREWRRKKYFPEPKRHNRAPWLTENQVTLLAKLKECLRVNKMRPASIKLARLKEVRAFIAANWN